MLGNIYPNRLDYRNTMAHLRFTSVRDLVYRGFKEKVGMFQSKPARLASRGYYMICYAMVKGVCDDDRVSKIQ
jgi:hypothetical protein